MTNEEILESYSQQLSSIGKSRTLYLKYARDFLEYADGSFTRATIDKFMNRMRTKQGYADGSINFAFRVIRTMFSRSDIPWPYRRGESPNIREDRVAAPAIHPATIGKMVSTARSNGKPETKAFLALSTTYGLRRVEMVEVEELDIRLKDKTIHIATRKHGRERTHRIPDQIVPYLAEYDFSEKRSESWLYTLWYQVEYSIGMKHIDQVGWHSIRRTLNTMLMRKLPEVTVMSFMRWKQRTSSHMPYRYSAQRFVGDEGETTEVVGSALDVDNEVFEVHPFLSFWE